MGKKQTITEHISTSKEIDIPVKEVVEFRSQVDFVKTMADQLNIESEEDMKNASDLLVQVNQVEKAIQERKEKITRPLMAGLSEARELFKPMEAGHAEAKKTIKAKMLTYTLAEEERIEKEKSRVIARAEKGTIRQDTAIEKLENIGDAPTAFHGENSRTSLHIVRKVRIVDETLIPREYLVPDMKKIQEAVLKQKLTVNGVEIYEEKSIVGYSR